MCSSVMMAFGLLIANVVSKLHPRDIRNFNSRSSLGVVENFCGDIFGSGAGEKLAEEMHLSFLGKIEMRSEYRDTSKPTVLNNNAVLDEYRTIADGIRLGLQAAGAKAE